MATSHPSPAVSSRVYLVRVMRKRDIPARAPVSRGGQAATDQTPGPTPRGGQAAPDSRFRAAERAWIEAGRTVYLPGSEVGSLYLAMQEARELLSDEWCVLDVAKVETSTGKTLETRRLGHLGERGPRDHSRGCAMSLHDLRMAEHRRRAERAKSVKLPEVAHAAKVEHVLYPEVPPSPGPKLHHPDLGWGTVVLVTEEMLRVRFEECFAWFRLDCEAVAGWTVDGADELTRWMVRVQGLSLSAAREQGQ